MHNRVARIGDVDALRGIALLGILQVNILAFSSVYYGTGLPSPVASSASTLLVKLFISIIFELKFYLIFSFLFGYSFTLQVRSAEKAGASFPTRFLRRQAGLLVIGLAHAALLFHGDILVTYAVLGLGLLWARGLSDRRQVQIAAGLIFACSALWALLAMLQWESMGAQSATFPPAQGIAALSAYRGDFTGIVGQHIRDWAATVPLLVLVQAPCAFAMFLFGNIAGRRQLLARPESFRHYLRPVLGYGIALGMPGAFLYAVATQLAAGTPWETAGLAVSILTAPLLAAAYIALILGAFQRIRGGKLYDWLVNAGRTALSNYLLQSVLCGAIFYGFGLGLIDRLDMLPVVCIAWGIFFAQLAVSTLWLRAFRQGPVEWLLRFVTR